MDDKHFMHGTSQPNLRRVNDPVIDKALDEARLAAVTGGEAKAFQIYRDMVKHVLTQAYVVPRHKIPQSHFWWPWIKNYTGEFAVGYNDQNWAQWVWLDQEMKKSMGY